MTMQPDQPGAEPLPPPVPPAYPPAPGTYPPMSAPPAYPPAPAPQYYPPAPAPQAYPPAPAPQAYPPMSAPPGYPPAPGTYPPPPEYPAPLGYPPAPGYAPVPPPSVKKSRVGLIVGICVAAVLLIAAAGVTAVLLAGRAINAAGAGPTGPGTTTVPRTTPAAVPTTPPSFTGDLRTLLLAKPSGATPLGHDGAADGTVSVTQAASVYIDKAGVEKELRDLEYQQGAATAWHDTQLRDVYLTLYQFRYEREAAQFSVEVQRGYQNAATTDSSAYFDEINGGRWFADKKESGNKVPVHAIFIRGNILVDITVFANTSADIDFTKKTAIQQYGQLP